jgi:hypothetical protein
VFKTSIEFTKRNSQDLAVKAYGFEVKAPFKLSKQNININNKNKSKKL